MTSLAPYFFALSANLSFALATVGFTHFTRNVSALWMNAFKELVALIAFGIVFVFASSKQLPNKDAFLALIASGLLGLCIGDWFLMRAFGKLGPSRTLILFGFQPLILGVAGYFLFNQTVDTERLIAILFLIGSLFTITFESFKKTGHWGFAGLVIGFIAICLDATGVILTRWAFDANPWVSPTDGNFYRCLGATGGFLAIALYRPLNLKSGFIRLSVRLRWLVVIASFFGTFLSLYFYLHAVQSGHLATVSGIAITGPLFAEIFESILQKRWPGLYIVAAFLLFAVGFSILVI